MKFKSSHLWILGDVHKHGQYLHKMGFKIHGNEYYINLHSYKLNTVYVETA